MPTFAMPPRERQSLDRLSCNEIPLDVAKATRSHHFDVLRDAGVIFTRCEGTKCMTSVRRKELNKRFPGLLKLIWPPADSSSRTISPWICLGRPHPLATKALRNLNHPSVRQAD
jgi:hypothetical protein